MPGHSRLGTSALLEREEEKALVKEGVCNAFLAMPCIMDCRICSFLFLKNHNSDFTIAVHRVFVQCEGILTLLTECCKTLVSTSQDLYR